MVDNRAWLRTQMPRKKDGSPDPICKAVLVALANYADPQGHCFPSQETLVAFTGYGESSVGRALKSLEEQGYISRTRRRATGTWTAGRFAGTNYSLELTRPPDSLERQVSQPRALAEHQTATMSKGAQLKRWARVAGVPKARRVDEDPEEWAHA